MTKISANMKGNGSLTILASVIGGMLFTMLSLNLVRYVGAKSALEQAVRRAARCLTPTDPECVSYHATGADFSRDWYRLETPEITKVQADERFYTASMTELRVQGEYETYLEHRVLPTINYSTYSVPLLEYRPQLNPYEHVALRMFGCAQERGSGQPRDPHFPGFSNAYEQGENRDLLSPEHWAPYYMHGGTRFPHQYTVAFEPHLTPSATYNASNQTYEFQFDTGELSVPNTIPALIDGSSCNNPSNESGPDSPCLMFNQSSHPWNRFARLVIKPFARIRDNQGSVGTWVGWGNLSIHTSHPEISPSHRNLGGRAIRRPGYNPDSRIGWINMWTRGPEGSHGGDRDNAHRNILAARGGSFRVTGNLWSYHNDISVDVYLKIYFDDFTEVPGAVACNWYNGGSGVLQNPATTGLDGPNTVEDIGLSSSRYVRWTSPPSQYWPSGTDPNCFVFAEEGKAIDTCTPTRSPKCASDAWSYAVNTFPFIGTASPEESACVKQIATCSSDWSPASFAGCEAVGPERQFCSWSAIDTGQRRELALESTECALTPTVQNHACGEAPFGAVNTPEECSGAAQLLASLQLATQQINQQNLLASSEAPQFSQLPHFNNPAQTEFGSTMHHPVFSGQNWVFSWQEVPEAETECHLGVSQRSCRLPAAALSSDVPRIWKSVSGSLEHVSRAISFAHIRGADLSSPPPEFFQNLRLSVTSEIVRQITEPYPFSSSPAHALLYREEDAGEFSHCPTGYGYPGTEEAKLRQFASTQIPEALDTRFLFTYTVSAPQDPRTQRLTFGVDEFNALTPSEKKCTPTFSLREPDYQNQEIVFLGNFPHASHPHGPELCQIEPCFSESSGELPSVEAPTVTTDLEAARRRGEAEFAHFAPGISFSDDCSGLGCASISVNLADSNLARIEANYNLPTFPPLSTFIGEDFLTITSIYEEAMEMRLAGAERFGE